MTLYPGILYPVPDKDAPGGEQIITDYDETLHRQIWVALQKHHGQIKPTQRELEMPEGGARSYLVRRIRELGQAGQLPWQE